MHRCACFPRMVPREDTSQMTVVDVVAIVLLPIQEGWRRMTVTTTVAMPSGWALFPSWWVHSVGYSWSAYGGY